MRRKTLGIWQRITLGDLADQMRRTAAGLIASDLDDQACIAAIGDNEPELFWAEYAIQATGRAAVCLYPDIPAEELLVNLVDCQAQIAFAEDQEQCDKLLKIADTAKLRMIIYWDDRGMADYDDPRVLSLAELQSRGDELLRANPDRVDATVANGSADDLAVVIYTSGTTGAAKGVMGSHRYLLDCADRWRRVLEAQPGCDYVSYISPAWATEQYLGLALGVSLPMVVNFPEEPETVTGDMREIGAEFLFFSPRQWEAIVSSTEARMRDATPPVRAVYRWGMKALAIDPRRARSLTARVKRGLAHVIVGRAVRDRLGFTYLKTAVNSGSTLSPEVFAFFRALGVSLRNVYGFTEIGIVTATNDEDPRDTVGKLLTSDFGDTPLEIRIADEEIQVRGGVIFAGYYNHPEWTAERFTPDGWVHSGDAGQIDECGRLIYLDRVDDLRKLSSGETIAPQFVETRIRLSPFIRDVIVVGEGRAAPGALIDIDMDMVGRWSEERKISFTSQVDLSQHSAVYALVAEELGAINEALPPHCRIWKFINLFKPLDADEGELTRSRKLRRAVVETKYADLVEGLYQGAATIQASIEMKFQDGRSRQLKSEVHIGTVAGTCPELPQPQNDRQCKKSA
jgi:long-chain acyl-CoA synthetase